MRFVELGRRGAGVGGDRHPARHEPRNAGSGVVARPAELPCPQQRPRWAVSGDQSVNPTRRNHCCPVQCRGPRERPCHGHITGHRVNCGANRHHIIDADDRPGPPCLPRRRELRHEPVEPATLRGENSSAERHVTLELAGHHRSTISQRRHRPPDRHPRATVGHKEIRGTNEHRCRRRRRGACPARTGRLHRKRVAHPIRQSRDGAPQRARRPHARLTARRGFHHIPGHRSHSAAAPPRKPTPGHPQPHPPPRRCVRHQHRRHPANPRVRRVHVREPHPTVWAGSDPSGPGSGRTEHRHHTIHRDPPNRRLQRKPHVAVRARSDTPPGVGNRKRGDHTLRREPPNFVLDQLREPHVPIGTSRHVIGGIRRSTLLIQRDRPHRRRQCASLTRDRRGAHTATTTTASIASALPAERGTNRRRTPRHVGLTKPLPS